MEMWRKALFSDEHIREMKRQYVKLLAIGVDDTEAERLIISYYFPNYLNKGWLEGQFYIALAVVEWDMGRLSEYILKQAMRWLSFSDSPYHENEICEIRSFLSSQMCGRKQIKAIRPRLCPWKEGDLLAYKIMSCCKLSSDRLWGKYVLLRVVSIQKWPITYIKPELMHDDLMIVALYDWIGNEVPRSDPMESMAYLPIVTRKPLLGILPDDVIANLKAVQNQNSERIINSALFEETVEYTFMLDWGNKKEQKRIFTLVGSDPSYRDKLSFDLSGDLCKKTLGSLEAFDGTISAAFRRKTGGGSPT